MGYQYTIGHSEVMREFLLGRCEAGDVDAAIASTLRRATYDAADEHAKVYLDLVEVNGNARITYTTMKRWQEYRAKNPDADCYDREGFRVAARPARIAQELTGITDGHALERFATAAQLYLKPLDFSRVHLVAGDDIWYWYNGSHACTCGFALYSCMVGASRDTLAPYRDGAQLAIVLCETCGGLRARGLIWTDAFSGERYVDRIYYKEAQSGELLRQAARMALNAKEVYGLTVKEEVLVPVRGMGGLPYFDTVRFCGRCHCVYFGGEYTHDCTRGALAHKAPHARVVDAVLFDAMHGTVKIRKGRAPQPVTIPKQPSLDGGDDDESDCDCGCNPDINDDDNYYGDDYDD